MRLIATLLSAIFLLTGMTAQAATQPAHLPALAEKFPIEHAGIMSLDKETRTIIQCLALNVYMEARGTIPQDQIAVAYVTKNRAASGKFEPTICGSVFQVSSNGHRKIPQFSWTRNRVPRKIEPDSWSKAQSIAYLVYTGQIKDPTHGALYFHDRDDFGSSRIGKIRIGHHVFVR